LVIDDYCWLSLIVVGFVWLSWLLLVLCRWFCFMWLSLVVVGFVLCGFVLCGFVLCGCRWLSLVLSGPVLLV